MFLKHVLQISLYISHLALYFGQRIEHHLSFLILLMIQIRVKRKLSTYGFQLWHVKSLEVIKKITGRQCVHISDYSSSTCP